MARPLRIEYHNAWYHVMNRGANRKFIFTTDEHRELFLDLLNKIVKLYSVEIHSYCIMGNHYHLLIKTPLPNLGKAMQYLNSSYAQKYNQMEKSDGPLFRGRYKAILVQEDNYLIRVSRYIHLNPFVAKICQSPEEYRWSSYPAYLNKIQNSFVITSTILEAIGGIETYIEFMQQDLDEELTKFYEQSLIPSILGDSRFKNISLNKAKTQHIEAARPDVKRVVIQPDISKIIEVIAFVYNIDAKQVAKKKQKNFPRISAIYLSKIVGKYSYVIIAEYFDTTIDAVRNIIRRYSKSFSKNKNIQLAISILADSQL